MRTRLRYQVQGRVARPAGDDAGWSDTPGARFATVAEADAYVAALPSWAFEFRRYAARPPEPFEYRILDTAPHRARA